MRNWQAYASSRLRRQLNHPGRGKILWKILLIRRCVHINSQFIQRISIDWDKIESDSYLRTIEPIRSIKELEFTSPITFFSGENGSGKSTLLEAVAIAAGFNPEGGTKNYHFSTYDSHSELYNAIRLAKGYRKSGWGYFLRAESFYNVATKERDYADAAHPSQRLHEQSHGESFLATAQKHLKPNGLYLLDEPEAALSPQRQLALLMELYTCAKQNSQFIIVSHSPILLGMPNAQILSFDHGQVHACSYEETESYQVMELFINNKNHLLKKLLGDIP